MKQKTKKTSRNKKKKKNLSFKKFTLFGLLFCVLLGSFLLIKNKRKKYFYYNNLIESNSRLWLFSDKRKFHPPKIETEKPITVVIPSYNNEKFCLRNLDSVFQQKYSNFRLIYIDDCSVDNTYELVKEHIEKSGKKEKATLIRNTHRKGALENFYRAIHTCQDNEIIVVLDGDDWFANDNVLEKVNLAYAHSSVWLTYGQYLNYPSYTLGCNRPLPKKVLHRKRGIREADWMTSHLRTFYAGLFKKIKLEDLLYHGQFFPSACDLAMMMPMLEMAANHSLFISDVMYMYNVNNPISDVNVNLQLQSDCDKFIRNLPSYSKKSTLNEVNDDIHSQDLDLVIFSYNRPLQLYACLESISEYVKGLSRIWVLYRASDIEYDRGYDEVKKSFDQVHFVRQSKNYEADFKPLLMNILFGEKGRKSPYVMFAVDDNFMKDYVNVSDCINAMEKTGALGFYLRLSRYTDFCYMTNEKQGIPESICLDFLKTKEQRDPIYAWQFNSGKCDWDYPCTLDMAIYRKKDLKNDFENIQFINPNTLEAYWQQKANHQLVGLYFENSKMINIPVNNVCGWENRAMNSHSAAELLEIFNQGLKINRSPLHQIINHAVHIEKEITFMPRD